MWYKNIAGRFFGLVTKHACDRRTDRQNYDSQDRASIAVSCGKNYIQQQITRYWLKILCATQTKQKSSFGDDLPSHGLILKKINLTHTKSNICK